MAEEHSGEGGFKGSGDFVARLADVAAALDRLEVGQASIGTQLSSFEAGQNQLRLDFLGELGKTRADVMGKVAELKGELTAIRDDISVNMGAVDMARQVNDNTREDLKQMREQLSVMWKQLKRVETEVRELRGKSP